MSGNLVQGIVSFLGFAIIIGPIFWFLARLDKKWKKEKEMPKRLKEMEIAKGIDIAKELNIIWKRKFEKITVDDTNKKIYYTKVNKKNIKDMEVIEIDYKSILNVEIIWDTHTETYNDWASLRDRRKHEEKVERQGIRLTLNDIRNPKLDILFADPDSFVQLEYKSYIEEWGATFNVILNQIK